VRPRDDEAARWPVRLRTFRLEDWVSPRGDPTSARACWRRARLDRLEKGSPEYQREALLALRENLPERFRNSR